MALVLTACSPPAGARTADASSDPALTGLCEVIAADEVAAITGGEVTATEARDGGECAYTIGESDLVSLRYEPALRSGVAPAREFCADAEDVPGVGDEALWCPALSLLYVRAGEMGLAVQLSFILDAPERAEREIAVDVARAALANR